MQFRKSASEGWVEIDATGLHLSRLNAYLRIKLKPLYPRPYGQLYTY